MEQIKLLSKNKERKLKKVLREYSKRLGISDPGERFTFRQHIIRICSRKPKIAAYVRPGGGKVNREQSARMVQYMVDNPIGDYIVKDLLVFTESGPKPKSFAKITEARNPKIDRRIRQKARDDERQKRDDFYRSWDWKKARYQALQRFGPVCMCCGAERGDLNPQGFSVKIVVDHIKPISKNWQLRLDQQNLQVLCDDCNMGKGAWDETDFRPVTPQKQVEEQLEYVV